MRFIVLLLLSFSPHVFSYTCNKSVDPKKVVLFVNANDSKYEAESVAKAACERGETFKTYPEQYKIDELKKRRNDFYKVSDKYYANNCDYSSSDICMKLQKSYDEKDKSYRDYEERYALGARNFKLRIKNYAQKDIAITSMIVSGHDGGGSIHGTSGGIDKSEIVEAMNHAYVSKPELKKEFKSVFMWGCWTMGPSEVNYWKENMPSLKMTGGFFDMGPLNTTSASRTIIHDLLVKEKQIYETCDQNKIKNLIKSVQNINTTWAAVYTEAQCSNMYWYRTQGQDAGPKELSRGEHFVNFDDAFDCEKVKSTIPDIKKEFLKYYYGATPIPTNTSKSRLREIYAFVRTHEHCLENYQTALNGDRILMMIFEQAVRKNFKENFEDDIKAANDSWDFLNKKINAIDFTSETGKKLKGYFQEHQNNYFKLTSENLKNKNRKELRKMISFLDGFNKKAKWFSFKNQKWIAKYPHWKEHFNNIDRQKRLMEKYLYQMDPNCMNFLQWHEYRQGNPAPPYCDV